MARLILSLDGQTLPDNDIRIDNAAVSGHHSLLINILNDSFLEDLNSTNGTYVNGKLIKKHALQHGDVVTVGHHQLRFVDQQEGDSEQDEDELRRVPQSGDQPAARLAPSAKPEGEQPVALPKAKLQVLSGAFAG